MKYLALIGLIFTFGVFAQQPGNTVTGPNVMCELESGDVKYIPVLICKHSGGKVVH